MIRRKKISHLISSLCSRLHPSLLEPGSAILKLAFVRKRYRMDSYLQAFRRMRSVNEPENFILPQKLASTGPGAVSQSGLDGIGKEAIFGIG